MKRSGFGMPAPKPARATMSAAPREIVQTPKDAPLRSEAYRRYVASLPCCICSKPGPTQCAHSDGGGKGMGIKTSDATCFPLCADSPGRRGCHSAMGASGIFTRDKRRELELMYSEQTRTQAVEDGAWPAEWVTVG